MDALADSSENFGRAREIFDKAVSLPPDERLHHVRQACGKDVVLADEVVQLLRAHQKADTKQLRARVQNPDKPANEGEATATAEDDPEAIGPFKIISRLGEGGMGTVYLAERRIPMRQRVALKVMKRGLDSKAFLARFEAERQALALMEHSSIAKVFDAGITESGQPYLAMEHVKGVPMTQYCDDAKLSIDERLELFVAVCSAMQHAHTKGVMHRDLKPSNILVSVQDGQALPKIIDFGLAKAVDHRLVEATVFTEQGQVIGTPEYMSPEQAGVGGLDVDTRTDVFSLGVLLYQLVTGALPVTREELLKHGWFEMQRFIREGEVPKPSTKVTSLGDGAEAYAKSRRIPLGELQRQLRGELDWIVMKALEKERSRRYTTVHEFAADLLRHLRNEPVTAGPPSATYLLRKMLARHRGIVAATGLVLLTLSAGLSAALWQWTIAEEQREDAQQATKQANDARLETARTLAKYDRLGDRVELLAALKVADDLPELAQNKRKFEQWVTRAGEWVAKLPSYREALASIDQLPASHPDRDRVQGFERDALRDLVNEIEAMRKQGGVLDRMKKSLAYVSDIEDTTIHNVKAAWREAAEAVRRHPLFDSGLVLTAQEGLIPIGTDPKTKLPEFWLPRTGEEPVRHPKTNALTLAPSSAAVVVLVPGGRSVMGSTNDGLAELNEKGRHYVELSPFFIGKYELTQHQWEQLAGNNPSKYQKGDTRQYPVTRVSWTDADKYLRRAALTLPTEAQWESACRAGTETSWYLATSKEDLRDAKRDLGKINIASDYARKQGREVVPEAFLWKDYQDGCPTVTNIGYPHFPPNEFGLYNMHGNVAEFTRGPAVGNYVGISHEKGDGLITLGEVKEPSAAVFRGGSYWKNYKASRSAARTIVDRRARWDCVGIRIARPLR